MKTNAIYLTATYNGELMTKTIYAWSRLTGIWSNVISIRYKKRLNGEKNYTDHEVVFGEDKKIIYLTAVWRGRKLTQTIREWARTSGVQEGAIRGRWYARGVNGYTDYDVIFGSARKLELEDIEQAFQKFCFKKPTVKSRGQCSKPFGEFDSATGMWLPNDILSASTEEQFQYNLKHGFVCECGYRPTRCQCKNASSSDA